MNNINRSQVSKPLVPQQTKHDELTIKAYKRLCELQPSRQMRMDCKRMMRALETIKEFKK